MASKFGAKAGNNPLGTGTKYRDPSLAESIKAVNKLVETLYSAGGFLMDIKNLGDVGAGQLPKSFDDPAVQKYITSDPKRKALL